MFYVVARHETMLWSFQSGTDDLVTLIQIAAERSQGFEPEEILVISGSDLVASYDYKVIDRAIEEYSIEI